MMKRKACLAGLMTSVMILGLAGCKTGSGLPNGAYTNEILTTKEVAQDKTQVTIRIESGIAQTDVIEDVLEEQFPEVDFVLIHDGSINSLYTIEANLKAGVECDLIFSRRLTTISDIAGDYLLDLSGEDFVDNYYVTAIDSCLSSDGKLYYLPGTSDFYGIVYDKTLFEQYGWELPHSYTEFKELLNTISEDTGLDAFAPSLMYADMFTIVLNTYGFEDAFAGVENYKWLTAYQNGTGSMVGHMEGAASILTGLFDDGILDTSDIELAPRTRSDMLYSQHTAVMTIECQNAVEYSKSFSESSGSEYHEVAMMPFWTSDEKESDYLYSIPSYYMAVNNASASESTSKKKLLLSIIEYISSVEGQTALLEGSMQMSSVKGVENFDDEVFSEAIRDTLDDGRIINAFDYASGEDSRQVEKKMRSSLADLVNGNISVNDWLLKADAARDDFLSGDNQEEDVYGQVTETLTRLESAYTVADMYRSLTGADIGICLGGMYRYGTNGHFYQGDITDDSLAVITPNKEPSGTLSDPMEEKIVVASLTGSQIIDILNSINTSADSNGEYPYYVASGLNVTFNPWADEGERVVSCTLADSTQLEADKTYEVAYFNGSLQDTSIVPHSALSGTWEDNFVQWLDANGGVINKPEMTLTLTYDVN